MTPHDSAIRGHSNNVSNNRYSQKISLTESKILTTSAFVILLLLCGDIEANPGPLCVTCNDKIGHEFKICEVCCYPVHTNCVTKIPEKLGPYCRSCFWAQISEIVLRNVHIQPVCNCSTQIQELGEKIGELCAKMSSNNHNQAASTSAISTRNPARNTRGITLPSTLSLEDNPTQRPIAPDTARSDGKIAVFLSRLSLSYSDNDIQTYIDRILGPNCDAELTRIRGFDHSCYSSFHVLVKEKHFNEIINPTHWPNGTLVKQYKGELQPHQKFSTMPEDDVLGIKRKRVQPNDEQQASQEEKKQTSSGEVYV